MNTPSSTPIRRWPEVAKDKKILRGWAAGGPISYGLEGDFAQLLGVIISRWSHLEEAMVSVLAFLINDPNHLVARQVFRSVQSSQARVAIMRTLLENSPLNADKPRDYDEILSEFDSITGKRNQYAHGLWFATEEKEKARLLNPGDTDHIMADGHQFAREVPISELRDVVSRLSALWQRVDKLRLDHSLERQKSSPPKPLE